MSFSFLREPQQWCAETLTYSEAGRSSGLLPFCYFTCSPVTLMSDEDIFPQHPEPGLPVALDASAQSTNSSLPAFLAPPANAPAYYGFPLVEETRTDNWVYGAITEFAYPEGCDSGDGFVQAPDGSRAGIVWGTDEEDGSEVVPPEEKRWGVYAYRYVRPVKTVEDMTFNFRAVLPDLQRKYVKVVAGKRKE